MTTIQDLTDALDSVYQAALAAHSACVERSQPKAVTAQTRQAWKSAEAARAMLREAVAQ